MVRLEHPATDTPPRDFPDRLAAYLVEHKGWRKPKQAKKTTTTKDED